MPVGWAHAAVNSAKEKNPESRSNSSLGAAVESGSTQSESHSTSGSRRSSIGTVSPPQGERRSSIGTGSRGNFLTQSTGDKKAAEDEKKAQWKIEGVHQEKKGVGVWECCLGGGKHAAIIDNGHAGGDLIGLHCRMRTDRTTVVTGRIEEVSGDRSEMICRAAPIAFRSCIHPKAPVVNVPSAQVLSMPDHTACPAWAARDMLLTPRGCFSGVCCRPQIFLDQGRQHKHHSVRGQAA